MNNLLQRCAATCAIGVSILLTSTAVSADVRTGSAPANAPTNAVTASSSLDFLLKLDRFLSLSVGESSEPVVFNLASIAQKRCSESPLDICFGNGEPAAAVANGSLPVTVRSNAGAIRLIASVKASLRTVNGQDTIPMSEIRVSSSDAVNLPAPLIPNAGSGAAVLVNPSSFGGRVTQRSARWAFDYRNTVTPAAGVYRGSIMFTATSP